MEWRGRDGSITLACPFKKYLREAEMGNGQKSPHPEVLLWKPEWP